MPWLGGRPLGVMRESGLRLVGFCEHRQQLFKEREVAGFHGGLDHRLDAVVARNEGRVRTGHGRAPRMCILGFLHQPLAPVHRPGVEGGRIDEQIPHRAVCLGTRGGVAQMPEGQREIGFVERHAIEQRLHELHVAVALCREPEFLPQAVLIGLLEENGKGRERLVGLFEPLLLVLREERDQTFGEPRQIPMRDAGLLGIGIAPAMVDRAEHGFGGDRRP